MSPGRLGLVGSLRGLVRPGVGLGRQAPARRVEGLGELVDLAHVRHRVHGVLVLVAPLRHAEGAVVLIVDEADVAPLDADDLLAALHGHVIAARRAEGGHEHQRQGAEHHFHRLSHRLVPFCWIVFATSFMEDTI